MHIAEKRQTPRSRYLINASDASESLQGAGKENIMARPSKFKPEYVEQARKLALLGATDKEISDFFEVSDRTLNRWKLESEEFCQSLKSGKEIADERVERSLFSRALGYEHDETDIRVIVNQIVETPIRKYYPPDTTACIFWLKNRRPSQWRDKQDVEHTGSVTLTLSKDDAEL